MIKIYVDTEEQKERLIDVLEDSSICPFLGSDNRCSTGRACRDCIKENIEFHVDSQKRK